jgi:hypothetical protein
MQLVPFMSSNCFKPSHLFCHLQATSIKLVNVIIIVEVVSCEFFGVTICNHFQAFKSLTLMSNAYISIFKESLWFLFLAICFCYWCMKINCRLCCNPCFWKKLGATIWDWMLFVFISELKSCYWIFNFWIIQRSICSKTWHAFTT